MDPVVDSVDCLGCGVGVKRTGRRGRPRKLCQACRAPKAKAKAAAKAKVYASEVCLRCGERLPATRNTQRVYCSDRCGNTAWVSANRAVRKALAVYRAALKAQGIEPA